MAESAKKTPDKINLFSGGALKNLLGPLKSTFKESPTKTFSSEKSQKHSETNKLTEYVRNTQYTLGDGDKRKTYMAGSVNTKDKIAKWGQLKLLSTELQFLTLYFDPNDIDPIVLYIGAAEGTHIAALAKMFPMIEFHLYDGRAFDVVALSSLSNVKLHQEKFAEKQVEMWKKETRPIYLISDIRLLTYKRVNVRTDPDEFLVNENGTWLDMELQQSWVEEIRPKWAHLKFRLPYYEQPVIKKYGSSVNYLNGIIYKQPWIGATSSETRLVVSNPGNGVAYPKINYNLELYEQLCFHFNTIDRLKTYVNPFTKTDSPISNELGLDNLWDSITFIQIIHDYLSRFPDDPTSEKILSLASILIREANRGRTDLLGIRNGIKKAGIEDQDDD